jgi:superfamily II DNA/RNA helicase
MSQRERNRTLMRLRRGDVKVLVATDVAARGIDVPGISHVINFDLPQTTEDYVHRIGRTGRAGANGVALTFASPKDQLLLQKIERYTGQRITPCEIPGFEARFKPGTGMSEGQNRGRFGGARRFGNGGRSGGGYRRSGGSSRGGYGQQRRGRPQAEVYYSDRSN